MVNKPSTSNAICNFLTMSDSDIFSAAFDELKRRAEYLEREESMSAEEKEPFLWRLNGKMAELASMCRKLDMENN